MSGKKTTKKTTTTVTPVPTIFRENDTAYQDWLAAHPEAFVLNLHKNPPMVRGGHRPVPTLHRSWCYHIRTYDDRHPVGCFTERDYFKVCGQSKDEVERWMHDNVSPQKTISEGCYCHTVEE